MKTKQIIIIISFFVIGSLNSTAQVKFGLRGGLNLATYQANFSTNDMVYQYHVGFFSRVQITEIFHFQPEVLFSKRGSYRKVYIGANPYLLSNGMFSYQNYIDVPLMIGIGKKIQVQVGVQPSILLFSNSEMYTPGGTYYFSGTEDYKSLELGLLTGVEHEFDFGFSYGIRVGYGLTSIAKDENIQIKNIVFQATVGYSFLRKR